jgi:hypothetical protein
LATREQSRARVIYGPPEQRRRSAGGGLGLAGMLALALLLFAGGLVIGRWTGVATPAATRTATAPGATTPPATTPLATTPRAASSAPATALPRAAQASGEQVWSGRIQSGIVPVGWAHSRAGAVGAATNYTAILSSEVLFDAAKRRLAVDAIAAPQARARLRRELAATASTVAAALARGVPGIKAGQAVDPAALDPKKVIFQTIPVRYRVELYDGTRARIAIWTTGVGGYQDSNLPVQEAWGVTTVELQWIDKDWKETSATVQDGPVPVADDTPPTPAPVLVDEAQQFKEYQYAPGQ